MGNLSSEFFLTGRSGTAVLMIHGFTGSPMSIWPWVEAVHEAGHTVSAPLLPGHGGKWQDLNKVKWEDWYERALAELEKLKANYERVFVAGFSAGGSIALRLAQLHGDQIEGLILCNAALYDDRWRTRLVPFLKYLIPSIPSGGVDVAKPDVPKYSYSRVPLRGLSQALKLWRAAELDLELITVPMLVTYSINDHVIHPTNSETIIDNVSAGAIREVVFETSFHNVAWDYEAEFLNKETNRFIEEVNAGSFDQIDQSEEQELIDAEFASIVGNLNLPSPVVAERDYLETLDEIEHAERFKAPSPRLPRLDSAGRIIALSALISALWLLGLIIGFDPIGLSPIFPVALALASVVATIWRVARPNRPDEDIAGEI